MPLRFRKQWVSDETFESAGVMDVDGDGVADIVSGGFWYRGPTFRQKCAIYDVPRAGEYGDDFSTIALDVNGDGRPDIVTGGWWGGALRWLENPADPTQSWPVHELSPCGNIETTRAWDMDGDGVLEIFPNNPGEQKVRLYKLKTDSAGKGAGAFDEIVAHEFPEGVTQGHGHGAGDIAGKGRMDIVFNHGWLEAPEKPWEQPWTWHPEFDLGCASNPILVADVNGDGLADLIVGQAHGYGLDWLQQRRHPDGSRQWVRHPIDPFNAQYHDLMWVDIDGDGACELVTGKRHRAHCGNEAGEWDDVGIYYFKWNGESFSKQVIEYGPIGQATGVGIHFALADLNGNGRPDLVAPGKDGLYVFWNEGAEAYA